MIIPNIWENKNVPNHQPVMSWKYEATLHQGWLWYLSPSRSPGSRSLQGKAWWGQKQPGGLGKNRKWNTRHMFKGEFWREQPLQMVILFVAVWWCLHLPPPVPAILAFNQIEKFRPPLIFSAKSLQIMMSHDVTWCLSISPPKPQGVSFLAAPRPIRAHPPPGSFQKAWASPNQTRCRAPLCRRPGVGWGPLGSSSSPVGIFAPGDHATHGPFQLWWTRRRPGNFFLNQWWLMVMTCD